MTGPKGSAGAQGSTTHLFNSSSLSTDEQFYYEYLKNFSQEDLAKVRVQLEKGEDCQEKLCTFLGTYESKSLLKALRLHEKYNTDSSLQKGAATYFKKSPWVSHSEPNGGPARPSFSKADNPVAFRLYDNLIRLGFTPEQIDGSGKGPWAATDKEICPQELFAFVDRNATDSKVRKALHRSDIRIPKSKKYQNMGLAEKMAEYYTDRAARLSAKGARRYRSAIRGNLEWATYFQPNNADRHTLLAGQLLIEKKYDAAIASYRRAYLCDPTAERKQWVGHAQYAKGDFESAKKIYTELLMAKPHDTKVLRLRIETEQALVRRYSTAKKLDEKSKTKKIETLGNELHADMALLKALTADQERNSLKTLESALIRAHNLSSKKKQALIEKLLLLGKSYQDLSFAQFGDPKDAELVRDKMNGLSHDTFALLVKFAEGDADPKMRQLVPLYRGLSLLSDGKLNEAVVQLKQVRNISPFADTVLKKLDAQKLRMKNLAAVEVLKSYNKEGRRIMNDEANGILGHAVGFLDSLFRDDGKTIQHDIAETWRLRDGVVSEIEKRITSGEAKTIYEALIQIKDDPKVDGKVKEMAVNEYLNASQIHYLYSDQPAKALTEFTGKGTYSSVRGRIIGPVIDFASAKNPDADLGWDLLQRTFELEADNNAVQTPFAVYALVNAFAPSDEVKTKANREMDALKGNSSIARSVLKMVYQTSPEELALDVVLMFLSAGLGNLAKLATLSKLEKAGVTGYKALALAGGAGLLVEGTTLWGLNTGKEAFQHDVSKVFSQEHLLKTYCSTLLMIGFLKGFGKLGEGIAPKALQKFGLLKNGIPTPGGQALQWMIGHGSGLTGMIASTKTSQALGLVDAPPGGWRESLVHDVVGYVQFAVAHKMADAAVGGKLTKIGNQQHTQIALKKAEVLAKGYADTLLASHAHNKEGRDWVAYHLLRASLIHPDFSSGELVRLYKKGNFSAAHELLKKYEIPLGMNEAGQMYERNPFVSEISFHEQLGVPAPEPDVHEVTPDMIVSEKSITPKPTPSKEKPFQRYFDEAARAAKMKAQEEKKDSGDNTKVIKLKPKKPAAKSEKATRVDISAEKLAARVEEKKAAEKKVQESKEDSGDNTKVVKLVPQKPVASSENGTREDNPSAKLAARQGPKAISGEKILKDIVPQVGAPASSKGLEKGTVALLSNKNVQLQISFNGDANVVYLRRNKTTQELEISHTREGSVAEILVKESGHFLLRPIEKEPVEMYLGSKWVPVSPSEGAPLVSGLILKIDGKTLEWRPVAKENRSKPFSDIEEKQARRLYNEWLDKVKEATDGLYEAVEMARFNQVGTAKMFTDLSLPNDHHRPLFGFFHYPSEKQMKDLLFKGVAQGELPLPRYEIQVRGEQRQADLVQRLMKNYEGNTQHRLVLDSQKNGAYHYLLKNTKGETVLIIDVRAVSQKPVSVAEAQKTFQEFKNHHQETLKAWRVENSSRGVYADRVFKLLENYRPGKLLETLYDSKASPADRKRAAEDLATVVAYLKDVPFFIKQQDLVHRVQNPDLSEVLLWTLCQSHGSSKTASEMMELYRQTKKDAASLEKLGNDFLQGKPKAVLEYDRVFERVKKNLKRLLEYKAQHEGALLKSRQKNTYQKWMKAYSGVTPAELKELVEAGKKIQVSDPFKQKIIQDWARKASDLPDRWSSAFQEFKEAGQKYLLDGDGGQKARYEKAAATLAGLLKQNKVLENFLGNHTGFSVDPHGAGTRPQTAAPKEPSGVKTKPAILTVKKSSGDKGSGSGTAGMLALLAGLGTLVDSKAAYAQDGMAHASDSLMTGGLTALGVTALAAAGYLGYRYLKGRVGKAKASAPARFFNPGEVKKLSELGIPGIHLAVKTKDPESLYSLKEILNSLIRIKSPDAETNRLIKKVVASIREHSNPSWLPERLNLYGREADGSPVGTPQLTSTELAYLGLSEHHGLGVMEILQLIVYKSEQGIRTPLGISFDPSPQGREIIKKLLAQYGPTIQASDPRMHQYLLGLFQENPSKPDLRNEPVLTPVAESGYSNLRTRTGEKTDPDKTAVWKDPDATQVWVRPDPSKTLIQKMPYLVDAQENRAGSPRRGVLAEEKPSATYGSYSAFTHEGPGKTFNEDAQMKIENGFVVADGMGGMGGEQAGAKASKIFLEAVYDYLNNSSGPGDLVQAFLKGHEAIVKSPKTDGGTVAIAHRIIPTGPNAFKVEFVHVGDTSGMVFRKDSHGVWQMVFRTQDQSLVGEMAKQGHFKTNLEMRAHPRANVVFGSAGLPNSEPNPVRSEFNLKPGDVILMSSDGITDNVCPHEISTMLGQGGIPNEVRTRIVDRVMHKMEWLLKVKEILGGKTDQGGKIYPAFRTQNGETLKVVELDSLPGFYITQGGNVFNAQGRLVDHFKLDNLTLQVYYHNVLPSRKN